MKKATPKSPKKLKGTVLFTVVSVMMVLIVFLVATLALATTASKRSYTNYQQEQAEYTAKAVMEAVTRQINNSETLRQDIVNGLSSVDVAINDGTSTQNHTVNVTNTGQKRSIYDSGEWKEVDMYRLSVTVDSDTTTAESTYETFLGLDIITTPAVIPPTPPTANDGGAFVSLGGLTDAGIADHGYTTGGTYAGIDGGNYNFRLNNETLIDAPLYLGGKLYANTTFTIHFTKPDDFMVIKGDFEVQNGSGFTVSFAGYDDTDQTYENTPYVYVDGKFSNSSNDTITNQPNDDHAFNLLCDSVDIQQFQMTGDMYLMDENGNSTIKTEAKFTKLYQWTKGNIERTEGYDTKYGNIYSMGSLTVDGANGLIVEGNVQVNGNLKVSNLTVTGDVVVNGTLTVDSKLTCNGKVYAGKISGGGSIQKDTGEATAVYAVENENAAVVPKLIPAELIPTSAEAHSVSPWYDLSTPNVKVDGEQATFGKEVYPLKYTKEYLTKPEKAPDGTIIREAKIENPQSSNYEASYPTSVTWLDSSIYDGGKYKVPIYAPSGSANTKYGSALVANGVMNADEKLIPNYSTSNPNGDGYYKVTTNCVLNGTFGKNIYIDGSVGNLTVILDNVSIQDANEYSIIINDANAVTLFIVGKLNLEKGCIITTDYLDMFKGAGNWNCKDFRSGGGTLTLQNDVAIKQVESVGNPGYPNVVIYSDDGAELNQRNGGLVVGLVRAPKLTYNCPMGMTLNHTIDYELPTGEIVHYGTGNDFSDKAGSKTIGLIGQLIAGKINLQGDGSWGMLYITTPASLTPDPLDPADPLDPPDPLTPGSTTSVWATLYGNMY
ncbi:MAG: polymer-forming cytoskeletal protein [Oscillospiraceae bacterium]|nr:polymer-forming cytoskeletal protein [Oscillospiraceae bacterium]